jgi:4-amino-4-deoxy-L-arabinose transferase-like glycosyltransferase
VNGIDAPATSSPSDRSSVRFQRWMVLALAVFVVFFQLGTRGLNEPDEGRFAEIGREMAATGDFLTPRFNGVIHLAKPPLTYWLVGLSIRAFGTNEWAARLPSALGALGTLLAVYLLARGACGERAGLWAVVVLLSSALFFGVARLITTDMLLTCFVTWSVWSLWRWYASADRSWKKILWFYVFLGLGMITKGPVAVMLPLLALAELRWRNPALRLRQMCWGKGALVFLAIAAPWFVAVAGTDLERWRYFVGREVVERMITTVHRRAQPWWFFLPVLMAGFLPWTPWLCGADVLRQETGRGRELMRLCAGWLLLGFVMFSLSGSKLTTYMTPLLPPLAIFVAAILGRVGKGERDSGVGRLLRMGAVLAGLLVLGAAGALGMVATRFHARGVFVVVVPLLAAAGGLVSVWLWRRRGLAGFATGLAGTTLAILLVAVMAFPSFERNLGNKAPAKYVADRIRREDPAGRVPVVFCGHLPRGLPFYLQRPVLWYHHSAQNGGEDGGSVFEFDVVRPDTPNCLIEPRQLHDLFAGSRRVICIASPKYFATMPRELRGMVHEIDEVGAWVVLSNQPLPPTGR